MVRIALAAGLVGSPSAQVLFDARLRKGRQTSYAKEEGLHWVCRVGRCWRICGTDPREDAHGAESIRLRYADAEGTDPSMGFTFFVVNLQLIQIVMSDSGGRYMVGVDVGGTDKK